MNSKTIARLGIVIALVAVGFLIDSLITGIFALPVATAAGTLIVVLVICQKYDLLTAVLASTVFGILSFIRAYTLPNLFSVVMQNPLISVLPRIFIGFTCYLSFLGLKKLFNQKDFRKYIPYIISGAIGVITNTGLVLTARHLFYSELAFKNVIDTVIGIYFIIEFLCSILVVPTVSITLKRVSRNTDNKVLTESKSESDENDNPDKSKDIDT